MHIGACDWGFCVRMRGAHYRAAISPQSAN